MNITIAITFILLSLWTIGLVVYTKYFKEKILDSYHLFNKNMNGAISESLQLVVTNQLQFFVPVQKFLNSLVDYYINSYIDGIKELIKTCDHFNDFTFEDIKPLTDNLTKICVDAEIGRSEHKHYIDVQIKNEISRIKSELESMCQKKLT